MATYMEHIRRMSDADFAYFLSFLQPEIPLLALAVERTEIKAGKRDAVSEDRQGTVDLNGDARGMYFTMRKDYDKLMRDLDNEYNTNAHL